MLAFCVRFCWGRSQNQFKRAGAQLFQSVSLLNLATLHAAYLLDCPLHPKEEYPHEGREDVVARSTTGYSQLEYGAAKTSALRDPRLVHHAECEHYLEGFRLGWYQVTIIFFLWSMVGLVLEEAWIRLSMGLAQSRAGLVWGPLSPMYGTGAVLLTEVSLSVRRRGGTTGQLFLVSMLVGGLLEQITGWGMETLMGAVSWNYLAGGIPGAITKWVAVPFLVVWGLLGCLWGNVIMPELLFCIGGPSTRIRLVTTALLGMFLAADIVVTLTCFGRVMGRNAHVPPANVLEQWVDDHYDNEYVFQRFGNMEIEGIRENAFDRAA